MQREPSTSLATPDTPPATPSALLYLSSMRGIFIGRLARALSIRHPCPMMALGLDHCLSANGDVSHSFLVNAGAKLTLNSEKNSRIALVFLDGSDVDYQAFQVHMKYGETPVLRDYRHAQEFIARLRELDENRPAIAQATGLIGSMVTLGAAQAQRPPCEAAVQRLLTYLRLNPVHNIPLSSIAMMERTSPAQLELDFYAYMGITVKEYQLWRRLFEVVYRYHAGSSLGQAAEACGFDSIANFNMHVRNFYGLEATQIFSKHTRIIMNRYGKTL